MTTKLQMGRLALRRRQRGLSLVEIAISVAIIAALLIGVMSWVRRIDVDRQLNATRSDAIASMNSAIAAYMTSPSTATATMVVLTGQNVWPSDRISNPGAPGAAVRSHFKGGSEHMFGNTFSNTWMKSGAGFVYYIRGVPAQACAQLATTLAAHPNAIRVTAGDTPANPPGNGNGLVGNVVKEENAPINMATLSAVRACGGSGSKQVGVAFFRS